MGLEVSIGRVFARRQAISAARRRFIEPDRHVMLGASREEVGDDDGLATISNRAACRPDDHLRLVSAAAQVPPARAARAAVQGPPPGPDSQVQPGTPAAKSSKESSATARIYPGTWREYWVYVPRQLDRSKPAPVMVFQDGLQYNAPVVFDNLIDKKEIPPIVGVFVMHGRVKAPSAEALDRMNRSFEYDAVERRLRAVPDRRDAAVRGEDPRSDPVDRPERSRDRRQQQRRHRRVRGGVAAARRLPARVQRHRHLRRAARRQRVPGAHPQDRAEADPRLPAGRPATI